ncbi:hypothetical protein [Actinomadura decatromicini]|uniref:DUF3558 domain-containing protein n=1 Tax=Actinomadura decatromicini TaxID=2604572 RepID=A0A5D3FH65_9ACTN|nr:hypothetical protein [Actinomadura decatromicini]TYK47206.1 hypothetical protein FXF68_25765 [Actinomadura decatromicini]
MITLKAALVAASAIGAVAAGGGATWAMTGSHHDAGLQSQTAKAPAQQRQVQDVPPATPPTCLPAKPRLPGAKVPDAGAAKKQVEQRLKQNPVTKDLPKGQFPKTDNLPGAPNPNVPNPNVPGVPNANVPKPNVPGVPNAGVPKAELPKAGVPGVKAPDGKLPANIPTCVPNPKDLGKKVPAAPKPDARVPGKPALPNAPKLDCDSLKPAVRVGSAVEKTVMLAKGLHYTSAVPGGAELGKLNICGVTQKWTGAAGQWITVETLKTPTGMTQNQLRQALHLPQGGTPVTLFGSAGWVGPGGNGLLLFDPNGYSLFVNGSPVFAGSLQDVTGALRQAG